jgi:hypothetical protein
MICISCSNKSKKTEPSNEPISPVILKMIKKVDGPLSKYLDVISDDTSLEILQEDGNVGISFTLKLKVSNSVEMPGGYESGSPFGPTLEYLLLDESKRPINLDGYRVQSDPDLDGISNNLNISENEFWIRIYQTISFDSESLPKIKGLIERAKYVQVTSNIQEKHISESIENTMQETNSNEPESHVHTIEKEQNGVVDNSGKSKSDCEEFLDAYEEFMDEYIKVLKKYSEDPTDMTILSEYTSSMAKVSEWSEKAESLEDCMKNKKFVKKYTAIQMKIANALSEIQ